MVRSVWALAGVSAPSVSLAFSAALRSSCSFGFVLALRMAIGLLVRARRTTPKGTHRGFDKWCSSLAGVGYYDISGGGLIQRCVLLRLAAAESDLTTESLAGRPGTVDRIAAPNAPLTGFTVVSD